MLNYLFKGILIKIQAGKMLHKLGNFRMLHNYLQRCGHDVKKPEGMEKYPEDRKQQLRWCCKVITILSHLGMNSKSHY